MSNPLNDSKIADVLRLKRQLKVYFAKKKNNTDPNNISNFRNVLKSLNREILRYKDKNKKILFRTIPTKPINRNDSIPLKDSNNEKFGNLNSLKKDKKKIITEKHDNFEFPSFLNDNIFSFKKENHININSDDSPEGIYLQAFNKSFMNNDFKIHFSSDDESYGKFVVEKSEEKTNTIETKLNDIALAVNDCGDEFMFDLE